MTAYVADINYPARFGRYKHSSAWCADPSMLENPEYAKSQFLQIDFLKLKRITGILTQGLGFSSVVTYYYLYYATDQGAFHSFRHGENNEIVVSILYCVTITFYFMAQGRHTCTGMLIHVFKLVTEKDSCPFKDIHVEMIRKLVTLLLTHVKHGKSELCFCNTIFIKISSRAGATLLS